MAANVGAGSGCSAVSGAVSGTGAGFSSDWVAGRRGSRTFSQLGLLAGFACQDGGVLGSDGASDFASDGALAWAAAWRGVLAAGSAGITTGSLRAGGTEAATAPADLLLSGGGVEAAGRIFGVCTGWIGAVSAAGCTRSLRRGFLW